MEAIITQEEYEAFGLGNPRYKGYEDTQEYIEYERLLLAEGHCE